MNIFQENEKEKLLKSSNELLNTARDSKSLIKQSLRKIKPERKRTKLYIVVIILQLIICILISNSNNTVPIFKNTLSYISSTYLGIFAVIITVFTLIQVLIGERLTPLLTLIPSSDKNAEGSAFLDHNLQILGLIFYYVFIIIINTILYIVFQIVPDNFYIPYFSNLVNEIISIILLYSYFIFIMHGLIELFSLVHNVFSVFCYNSYLINLKVIEDSKKKDPG